MKRLKLFVAHTDMSADTYSAQVFEEMKTVLLWVTALHHGSRTFRTLKMTVLLYFEASDAVH